MPEQKGNVGLKGSLTAKVTRAKKPSLIQRIKDLILGGKKF